VQFGGGLLLGGLPEALQLLTAYEELAVRAEPDTARDPFDDLPDLLDPQPKTGRPCKGNSEHVPATVRRLADAACRQIDHKAELLAAEKRALPKLPHPSRIRSHRSIVVAR